MKRNILFALLVLSVFSLFVGLLYAANGDLIVNGNLSVGPGGVKYSDGSTQTTAWLPAGTIIMYGASTAPSGWLACNGSAVSRTTYATLFAVIGTTFGAGDGSTTFNVPDFRRRVAVGSGGVGSSVLGNTIGSLGGEETHTLSIAEMPVHTHGLPTNPGSGSVYGAFGGGNAVANSYTSSSTGGGGAHNIMQPSLVVRYIIKY